MVSVPARSPLRPRLISGGQTGVDRAALDLALEFGLRAGGWCPRGRRAEDGALGARYPLRETASADPAERTARNVADAPATLIFSRRGAPLSGGTALTAELAEATGRPWLLVEGGEGLVAAAERVRAFLTQGEYAVVNVAGPRASQEPGVGEWVRAVLIEALDLEDRSQWSLWLLPVAAAAATWRRRIAALAEAAPPAVPFEPHLSLASLPVDAFPATGEAGLAPSPAMRRALVSATGDVSANGGNPPSAPGPLRLTGTGFATSAVLARSLYLAYPPDPALDSLAAAALRPLGLAARPVALPHLSLAYPAWDAPERERQLARAEAEWSAEARSPMPFGRLAWARTSRGFTRPAQAAGWRCFPFEG